MDVATILYVRIRLIPTLKRILIGAIRKEVIVVSVIIKFCLFRSIFSVPFDEI